MEQHWKIHFTEKLTYNCDRCGKNLSKHSHLKRHIKNVHAKLVQNFTPIQSNRYVDLNCALNAEYYTCNCDKSGPLKTCIDDTCCNVASQIECDSSCNNSICQNQHFRQSISIKDSSLYIKITNNKGWGLFFRRIIPQDQFIIEYVGELIDEPQLKQRMHKAIKNRDHDFYHVKIGPKSYIDAKYYGNLSRFINHSCDPNCRLERWTAYDNGERTKLGFFSNREILVNEEIVFDYNWQTNTKCLCESKQCRNFI